MTARPAWMAPRGTPWARSEARTVFDNPWLTVSTYEAVAPTGNATPYGVVHFKNRAIAILPLFEDGSTILVGQHRFPAQDYSWEIPEGGAPLDEDPAAAARRELEEEAGVTCEDLRQVLSYQLSNSVTDEYGFGYIALGLTATAARPDETEDLALVRVPFKDALDLALAGEIKDMLTVAMLLRGYHMAREGRLPPDLAQAMIAGSPVDRTRGQGQ